MAEDSILYPHSFSILIWFMIATSKGYSLTQKDIEWILGLVHTIATEEFIAPCSFKQSECRRLDIQEIFSHPSRDFIYSLALRRSYGGTKGDVSLLDNAITFFLEDILTTDSPVIISVSLSDIKPLQICNWELAAVDFHVCDVLSMF